LWHSCPLLALMALAFQPSPAVTVHKSVPGGSDQRYAPDVSYGQVVRQMKLTSSIRTAAQTERLGLKAYASATHLRTEPGLSRPERGPFALARSETAWNDPLWAPDRDIRSVLAGAVGLGDTRFRDIWVVLGDPGDVLGQLKHGGGPGAGVRLRAEVIEWPVDLLPRRVCPVDHILRAVVHRARARTHAARELRAALDVGVVASARRRLARRLVREPDEGSARLVLGVSRPAERTCEQQHSCARGGLHASRALIRGARGAASVPDPRVPLPGSRMVASAGRLRAPRRGQSTLTAVNSLMINVPGRLWRVGLRSTELPYVVSVRVEFGIAEFDES
jgi:hypothetical protein